MDPILRNSKHAANLMTSLQPMDILLKLDLSSGLFLSPICRQHRRFCGPYYGDRRLRKP
jgi:hypothetical protein